jgi:hypothetical protein
VRSSQPLIKSGLRRPFAFDLFTFAFLLLPGGKQGQGKSKKAKGTGEEQPAFN